MFLCINNLIFKLIFGILIMFKRHAGIGEVVNTADCGSVMQGFNSLISAHFSNKISHTWDFFVNNKE